MTSISQDPARLVRKRSGWVDLLRPRQVWASLAIVVMWLAVLFDAVYGPDIVNRSGGPAGTVTTVPSAIAVAFFAFLATGPVARHGFGGGSKPDDDR